MNAPHELPEWPARPALFLDFDGTLVELAERPELIALPPGLGPLLEALLGHTGGAVAIVTGRRLEAVDHYLSPLVMRGAGLHGAQMRIDSTAAMTLSHPFGDLAKRLRERFPDGGPVWVEDKGAAVALHYREAPEQGPAVERVMRATVGDIDAEVIAGKFIFEARPRGISKGGAVKALMTRAPFQGRTAVFIGDDTTDEDGILAAQALGGVGVRVGTAPSAARCRLADPQAVRNWLEKLLERRV